MKKGLMKSNCYSWYLGLTPLDKGLRTFVLHLPPQVQTNPAHLLPPPSQLHYSPASYNPDFESNDEDYHD